jgi:hypothetical protein
MSFGFFIVCTTGFVFLNTFIPWYLFYVCNIFSQETFLLNPTTAPSSLPLQNGIYPSYCPISMLHQPYLAPPKYSFKSSFLGLYLSLPSCIMHSFPTTVLHLHGSPWFSIKSRYSLHHRESLILHSSHHADIFPRNLINFY